MLCEERINSEYAMFDKSTLFVDIVRGPYIISSRNSITEDEATVIVQALRQKKVSETPTSSSTTPVLGGRSTSTRCILPSCGKVFIKHYSHGGVLRSITGGYFIGSGRSRSEVEFEMLERVRELGIAAPKPVAVVTKGALIYETWLLMEELSETCSLVEIQHDDQALHNAMRGLAGQVLKLVEHKIFHVDLHPGNVLIDSAGGVSLIDFDKATVFHGDARMLRDLYLRRWRRAVIKHKLSPIMSEMMALALRRYDA